MILITYYNRLKQLEKTLQSIQCEVPVIIVDDGSDIPLFGDNVIRITKEEKYWLSDCTVPINRGIERMLSMGADKIILQGAECYHVGDIVNYVEKHLTDENYISFPCFSLGKNALDGFTDLNAAIKANDRPARYNGDYGWYNHKEHRPTYYNFCSAITAANLQKLNGFDERFSHGVAMADEDFTRRIKLLGLRMHIPDYPLVIHQWHYDGDDPYSRTELFEKNKMLAEELKKTGNIRAKHLITKDYD